jgi:hypothetical protein
MASINVPRVILGGLAAGLVMNVLDVTTGLTILADDMNANAQRLNLDPAVLNSTAAMVTWIIVDFLYGLLVVFTYAGFRPRFGPGPKTAVIAGLTIYAAITVILAGFLAVGMFMQDVFIKQAAIALVVNIVASLVGAAIYKET